MTVDGNQYAFAAGAEESKSQKGTPYKRFEAKFQNYELQGVLFERGGVAANGKKRPAIALQWKFFDGAEMRASGWEITKNDKTFIGLSEDRGARAEA